MQFPLKLPLKYYAPLLPFGYAVMALIFLLFLPGGIRLRVSTKGKLLLMTLSIAAMIPLDLLRIGFFRFILKIVLEHFPET